MNENISKLKILHIPDTCTACSACLNVCPKNAISISAGEEGFYYPSVDPDLCIDCKLCDKTCPVINPRNDNPTFSAYYGYSTNRDIISSSSSGGAFYALATEVLNSNGVIFGAVFNYGEAFRLEHRSSLDFPISALMKSKYVQSYIGDSFREVKKLLNQGRKVMFVGTPCQVNGLTSFLKKDYDNLLKVDFICHGVPSMDMFKKHLNYLSFADLSKITRVDFRPKLFAWVDYLVVETDRKKYRMYHRFDEYFNCFQKNRNLRRSCMFCTSCNGRDRSADITLADFWGYKNAGIAIPDGIKGLSLMLGFTEKGISAINRINGDSFKVFKVDNRYAEYVFSRQRDNADSGYEKAKRNELMTSIYGIGYSKTIRKFNLSTKWHKIFIFNLKVRIKKLIGRI